MNKIGTLLKEWSDTYKVEPGQIRYCYVDGKGQVTMKPDLSNNEFYNHLAAKAKQLNGDIGQFNTEKFRFNSDVKLAEEQQQERTRQEKLKPQIAEFIDTVRR